MEFAATHGNGGYYTTKHPDRVNRKSENQQR